MKAYYFPDPRRGGEKCFVPASFVVKEGIITVSKKIVEDELSNISKDKSKFLTYLKQGKVVQVEVPQAHLKQLSDLVWGNDFFSALFKAKEIYEFIKEDAEYQIKINYLNKLKSLEDKSQWWKNGGEMPYNPDD